ncbi:MAG: AraC family transcriptional regulator [Bacteroidetes bacterium]|nr:AraC family transcriptional regulator [Bacteroidota bacterium]
MKSIFHIPVNSPSEMYASLIWEVEGVPGYARETILPRGCFEIIFNFSERITYIDLKDKVEKTAPLYCVIGYNTMPITGHFSQNHHFFGIRLKASAVSSIFRINPGELTNELIDLTLIRRDFHELWEKLYESDDFQGRMKIVEKFFQHLKIESCCRLQAIDQIMRSPGLTHFDRVEDLAAYSCYSIRQLQRNIQKTYGVSPNELLRYKKFLSSVLLMHKEGSNLTQIAHQSGFYDQSHFGKTFKSYTTLSPKEYYQNKSHIPFHLYV